MKLPAVNLEGMVEPLNLSIIISAAADGILFSFKKAFIIASSLTENLPFLPLKDTPFPSCLNSVAALADTFK
ncbi:hypothetical protein ABLU29_02560 [Lactococcus lactis]|uniref:hypothetical protein n=1 Tax=Lactococcus lactis TaxID=1358 RepID=UPI0038783A11